MRPRVANQPPGSKPELFIASSAGRVGRSTEERADRHGPSQGAQPALTYIFIFLISSLNDFRDMDFTGGSFDRGFVQNATTALSPSHNRLSPRPTLLSAGKSPQFLRQQAMAGEEQVRASPGPCEAARQQQHPSPAPMRSRVVESGFHSTAERSRPPSPAPTRGQESLPDCRTPVQQNRLLGGPFTPSSAPTMARTQVLPQRQQMNAAGKPMISQSAAGVQQLSNTALVAQRFGAGSTLVSLPTLSVLGSQLIQACSQSGGKPSSWNGGSGQGGATPRLVSNGAQRPLSAGGSGEPELILNNKLLTFAYSTTSVLQNHCL